MRLAFARFVKMPIVVVLGKNWWTDLCELGKLLLPVWIIYRSLSVLSPFALTTAYDGSFLEVIDRRRPQQADGNLSSWVSSLGPPIGATD